MGWPKCCVEYCGENKKLRFRFPHPYSDRHKRFGEWLKRIGDEKLNALDPMVVYNNRRICFRHFSLTCYVEGTVRLKKDAIPTRFPRKPFNLVVVENTATSIFAPLLERHPEQSEYMPPGLEDLVIKLEVESDGETGDARAAQEKAVSGEVPEVVVEHAGANAETVEMTVLNTTVTETCAGGSGPDRNKNNDPEAAENYRYLSLITDPVGTLRPIKVTDKKKGAIDVSQPISRMTAVDIRDNEGGITTGELMGVRDDQPPESSTNSASSSSSLYASLFGSIPKGFAANNEGPVLVAPVCEGAPSLPATEPLSINIVLPLAMNIVVPAIPPNVPSCPSVPPIHVVQHDPNVPGNEMSVSLSAPGVSNSAVIPDVCDLSSDPVHKVPVVLPGRSPVEQAIDHSNVSETRGKANVGAPAEGDHLFSIPGSVFAQDAQTDGGKSTGDQSETPAQPADISEPVANDDDSSNGSESVFSHCTPVGSPRPEKVTMIDGIAVEQLAQTLLAGYMKVTVVPVSDPYYRYKLCRLCFRAGKKMTMIFGGTFSDYDLKGAIEDLVQFKVSNTDDYPQGVCEHCLPKLTKFKRFKDQFREGKEYFDEELRKHNKKVDECSGYSSLKAVQREDQSGEKDAQELQGHSDHEYSAREEIMDSAAGVPRISLDAEVATTSRQKGPLDHKPVVVEGERTDSEMSAHDDFDRDVDMSSEGGREEEEVGGGVEEVDFPVPHEEEEKKGTKRNRIVKEPKRVFADGVFGCQICGAEFMYKNVRKEHMKEHEKTFSYPCSYCERRFQDLQKLNSHIVCHSDHRPFECEMCGRRFRRPKDLVAHKDVHWGVRKHLCPDCGKAFLDLAGLYRHEAMHKAQNSYICNVCQKVFKTSSNLKSHMAVHMTDATFECEVCGKRYTSSGKLCKHRRHMHGPNREFPCDVCHKVYTSKDNMNQHRKRHFGLVSSRKRVKLS